jgi:hypothetical protein
MVKRSLSLSWDIRTMRRRHRSRACRLPPQATLRFRTKQHMSRLLFNIIKAFPANLHSLDLRLLNMLSNRRNTFSRTGTPVSRAQFLNTPSLLQ